MSAGSTRNSESNIKKMYKRNGRKAGAPAYSLIQNALKDGTLPRVLLMYGPENYLIRWVTGLIRERYVQDAAAVFDCTDLEGFSMDSVVPIIDACEMMPMMSEKRVVIVTDLNPRCRDLELLTDYLEKVPDTTVLLIIQEEESRLGAAFSRAARAAGQAYEFSRVDRRMLEGFIKKYLRQAGVEFRQDAVDALIEVSGYFDRESDRTLDTILADIGKIAAHSDGKVTAEDVSEAVMGNEERDVFAFTDALASGDKAQALQVLRTLLSYGGSEFSILGLICSQFETMMLIREAEELRRPASFLTGELKLNAYRVRLLSGPASRYSSVQIKEILKKAYEVDRNVKTGVMEAPLALELFVAGV